MKWIFGGNDEERERVVIMIKRIVFKYYSIICSFKLIKLRDYYIKITLNKNCSMFIFVKKMLSQSQF